jgi:hypothetical protein
VDGDTGRFPTIEEETLMNEIRLEDATINFGGEWLSADEIKARIKEKMDGGDMKFADLAAALETLNKGMENAHALEVKVVITKAEYEKLRKAGGDDDNASVRAAIKAFIGGRKVKADAPKTAPKPEKKAKPAGKAPDVTHCTKCKSPIEVPSDERPLELECEFCGTSIVLTDEAPKATPAEEKPPAEKTSADEKSEPRRQDHFIG